MSGERSLQKAKAGLPGGRASQDSEGQVGQSVEMTGSLVKREKVVIEKLKGVGGVSHTTDACPGTRLRG